MSSPLSDLGSKKISRNTDSVGFLGERKVSVVPSSNDSLISEIKKANSPSELKSLKQALESHFQKVSKEEGFSGSVLIAQKGEILLDETYGQASSLKDKGPLTYRYLSITKTITAVAVLQLAETGKVDLDKPITDYLIEYQDEEKYPGFKGITVRELLAHLSKAPDHPDYLEKLIKENPELQIEEGYFQKRQEPKEMIENIMTLPQKKKAYGYNNFAFTLLGCLVEKIAKKSYADYVQKNIFDRAKMKTARAPFYQEEDRPLVEGFSLDKNQKLKLVPVDDAAVRFASGNIYGSAKDLYLFDRALKKGKLLGSEFQKQMVEEHLGYDPAAPTILFGKKVRTKGGGMEGCRTVYHYFPETDTTLIILGNTNFEVFEIAEEAAEILFRKNESGKWAKKHEMLLPSRKHAVAQKYWNLYVENGNKDHTNLKDFLGAPKEFDEAIRDKNFPQFLSLFQSLNTDALFLINERENLNVILTPGPLIQEKKEMSWEELDDLKCFLKDTGFSGSLSISDGKKTRVISSSRKHNAPFCIHSISKACTGISALLLIQEGIIDKKWLDLPLEMQLEKEVLEAFDSKPLLRKRLKEATLLQVMTHTGGFGDYTVNYEKALNEALKGSQPLPEIKKPEDLLVYADKDSLTKLGEKEYSNLDTLLLGFAIQFHGKMSCEEILKKKLLEPAGISLFSSRMPKGAIFNPKDPASQYIVGSPAGGHWTTAFELQKLGRWIYKRCKKDPEFRKLLETYGSEFFSKENQEVFHNGIWTAASACFSVFLKSGFIMAILSDQGNFATGKVYGNIVDFILREKK